MDKIILHCDLNNFYASCECLDHPELRNHPIAVCGSADDRHGIILAKNDLAKAMGVKTAEVIWEAKAKCPHLLLVPPNHKKYVALSKQVRKIYEEYTDLVEPFGIDECWLDVTGSRLLFGDGEQIANTIRTRVKSETGLTISVGVSFNKIFAKLGSDLKKPDAVTVISKENFKNVVWGLQANELLGIGKSTFAKLNKYGIKTIGDIAHSEASFISSILGKNGESIWYCANGIGGTDVAHQSTRVAPKSIGNSHTLREDLVNVDEVWPALYQLAESVSQRLRKQGYLATAIQITVKDNALSVKEFQTPLPFPTRLPKEMSQLGFNLFKKNYIWENNIRMVGIRAINLIPDDEAIQCSFMINQEKNNELEALEDKVLSIREKYGSSAVVRGSLLKGTKPSKEASYNDDDSILSKFNTKH